MENQRKYRKIILLLFLQNVEEERFLLLSNPKTGGKLVENWRKTGGKRNVFTTWQLAKLVISFVSFNGNPGKNEGLNFEEHEGHH